jgi:pimeloyl-ACP methyl ester carboxylesterase
MTLELAYTETGEGPPLVILHGLFGSSRNWGSIARRLGETHRVFAVDLRNHGASPWADTMDYGEMAEDLRAFLARHGLAGAVVMGHSMGGKTAMRLALDHGGDVGRLIVVDIAPVAYDHSHGPMVEALRAVDLAAAGRRAEVDRQLQAAIPEAALRSFLLHNLVSEDGRLRWRINLAALAASMDALIEFPADPAGITYRGPAHFLRGAASDYVREAHHARIRELFPNAEIDSIPDAGHWVHAEQPAAFLERVRSILG